MIPREADHAVFAEFGAHAACPRARDGGSGPRRCRLTSCRLHVRNDDSDRPVNVRRRALALELPDTCSLDIAERARCARPGKRAVLTLREIAVVLGTDPSSVLRSLRGGMRKVRLRVAD